MVSEDKTPVEDFGPLVDELRALELGGREAERRHLEPAPREGPPDLDAEEGDTPPEGLPPALADEDVVAADDDAALADEDAADDDADADAPRPPGDRSPTLPWGALDALTHPALGSPAPVLRPVTSPHQKTGPVRPAFQTGEHPREAGGPITPRPRTRPSPPAPRHDTPSRRLPTTENIGPNTRRQLEEALRAGPPPDAAAPPGSGSTRPVRPTTARQDLKAARQALVDRDIRAPAGDAGGLDLPVLRAGASGPPTVDGPVIRSSRLRHVATRNPGPRVVIDTGAEGVAAPGVNDDAPARPGAPLARLHLVPALVLLSALALPGARDGAAVPPWVELLHPGSPAFTAAAFLLLLGATAALRGRAVAHGFVSTLLGAGLVSFGLVHVSGAVAAGAFDGQPALDAIFLGHAAPRVVLLLSALTLPTALLWRSADPASIGARVVAGTGLALVAFAYFGLRLPSVPTAPVGLLADAAAGAAFLGDRLAAWLAWGPALAALLAVPALVLPGGRARPAVLALLFWAAAWVPLLVLAAFVAPADQWTRALEPLQAAALLGAGLLLLPLGLAGLLAGAVTPGPSPRRAG